MTYHTLLFCWTRTNLLFDFLLRLLIFSHQDVGDEDIKTLQDAMEVLAAEKKSLTMEKEELEELREEMAEYKEVKNAYLYTSSVSVYSVFSPTCFDFS